MSIVAEATTAQDVQLDVRPVEPKNRLDTILGAWKDLSIGNSLFLNVDHDPECMYYTLIEEYGKEKFTFEYLEKGPIDWKVKVTKNQ